MRTCHVFNCRSLGSKSSLLPVAVGAALATTVRPQEMSAPFRVRVPRDINPANVVVQYDRYGAGMMQMRGAAGVYDINLHGTPYGKMVLYCPGYQTLATHVTEADFSPSKTFAPQLKRIPMVSLAGRLLDTQGRPVAGEKLSLSYSLREVMPFFGYYDGPVPRVPIATATTDAAGRFTMKVPSLMDDPFTRDAGTERNPGFWIYFGEGLRSLAEERGLVVPGTLPVRRTYPRPIVLRRVHPGAISGRIDKAFLERNELPSDLSSYLDYESGNPFRVALKAISQTAAETRAYDCVLRPDRTFEQKLLPGSYELVLVVLNRNGLTLHKRIVVRSAVMVEEGEQSILHVP